MRCCHRLRRRAFGLVLVVLAIVPAACSRMTIAQPANQASVGSPVAVRIQFSDAGYTNFAASVDGADRTSAFARTFDQATASLMLPPGPHTLSASADVSDRFYRRDIAHSVSSTFVVPGPSFSASSDRSLVLRRFGGSANLTVTLAPVGGFSAPVTLTVPNPPPGIGSGTTTVAAGSTTGQLALTASGLADYGDRTVTVRADGGGVSATTTFTLRVFHAAGPFAKASFAVTTPPQTAASSSGTVRVTARLGTDEGLPSAFAAVFERQAGGTGRLGQPVPYNHGQTNVLNQAFGGAGFCPGPVSTAGFVVAGKGPGVVAPSSAQYVASVFHFTSPLMVGQADVASVRTSPAPYYFEPAVYFNADCTLALAVGAHPTGPENNVAQVLDLKTTRVIDSIEFSAPSFSAALVDAGARQRIDFTAGGQTQSVTLP